MKKKVWMTIAILALLLTASCAKTNPQQQTEAPTTTTTTQTAEQQLAKFIITASATEGLNPNELVVKKGARLEFRAYGADLHITEPTTGLDLAVPAEEKAETTFAPGTPGKYTLTCEGCPQGKKTLTITVK